MKIFITGIAGFLGSHIAERLISSGHTVAGIDNILGGYIDNIPPIMTGPLLIEDCLNHEAMAEAMEDYDVVFHAACTPYEGLSVFSPALVCETVYAVTASVLSASISAGVERFVYCSSMARYGTQDFVPFTEDMLCYPQDPYGISKLASESLVHNLCSTHGMDYSIVVPHNIYGPRQKYDDPYRNVAAIMCNLMLQGRQPFIYGDGTQKRCFSYIDDVTPALQRILFEEGMNGEIVNIGPDDEPVTILDLAEQIAELIGIDFNPTFLDPRPQEVYYANCSANKARALLDYRTETSLTHGLEELIAYIEKRGTKPFTYHLPLEIDNHLTPRSWKERLF